MCINCDTTYFFSEKQSVQLGKELNVDKVVSNAVNQLYDDRKVSSATHKDLFKITYEPLKQAVNEGFGTSVAKIEFGSPNYEMLKNLQTNTAVFAMFKSHSMVKEMAALLKDKDGNLRDKEAFKREALKIDATYRVQHLETQYDTAVRASRMATIWAKAQQSKKLYPNLKYLRSRAANPDEKHLAFVGITLPIDDPFWITNYPPNRWKCQCGVEPSDDEVTDVPQNLPEVPEEFRFNAGITGQVFDLKNSNYIKSVPPAQQPALIKQADKVVNKDLAKTVQDQTLYTSKKGGNVTASPLAFDNNDFNDVLKTARSLANEGNKVQLLPDITDSELRKHLLPKGVKENKNPDYLINSNMIADEKKVSASGKKSVAHAIDEARQQGDNVVIVITDENKLTEQEVIKQISQKASFEEMKDFKNVWVNYKGNWLYNPHKKQKPE